MMKEEEVKLSPNNLYFMEYENFFLLLFEQSSFLFKQEQSFIVIVFQYIYNDIIDDSPEQEK
jgi:hypothetical protein